MSKTYFTYASIVGILGALFLSFFLSLYFLSFVALSLSGLFILFSILKYSEIRKFGFLGLVFCLCFFIGILRAIYVFKDKPTNHIIHYLDKYVSLEGKICSEVDIRTNNVKYTFKVFRLNKKEAQGKILINAYKYPLYEYGDILKVNGYLKTPTEDENFSYKEYLSRYEIYGILENAEIIKISSSPDSKILKWIFKAKTKFLERINSMYQEPYASFLAGLLIGARKGMNEDIVLDFQITGLAHIVAVSGSNITMVLSIVLTILKLFPRFIAFTVAVSFVVLFTIFVGMSAAVVRAAIMGVIALIAIQTGRPNAPLIALLITVLIMSLYQPKMLVYDVGFQLSVCALIGVIWVVPLMPKFFQKLPEIFGIKEAVALTIAAQITTLPISIIQFKAFSIIAPIANLFVVPQIPLAMLFGFLSMIPIPMINDIFCFITFIFLKLSLFFAHFFASIPYAQITNIEINNWFLILYFFILGLLFFKYYQTNK